MLLLNPRLLMEDKPQKSFCSIATHGSPSLYDMVYSINEEYYDTLLSLNKKVLLKETFGSVIGLALDWLIPASAKFLKYVSKNSRLLDVEMTAIVKELEEDETKTYQHHKFFVKDIKYAIPMLPIDIGRRMNKLSYFENALTNPSLLNKMNGMLFFEGDLIAWFLKYTTPETMSTYLENNAHLFIKEGFYKIKDILPKIKKYSVNSLQHYTIIRDDITKQKQSLDQLSDKVKESKKKILKLTDTKYKTKMETAFNKYESAIDLAYLQLSVYQRALIFTYGKYTTEISNVVHSMFDEIPDNHYIKDNSLKSHTILIQNMKKELI